MPIYNMPPPHERLNVFFGELFARLRKEKPKDYGPTLIEIEQKFHETGYRDKDSSSVENILIVRIDAIGDQILTSGFIREVRKNFPHARITLLVNPTVYPIVELCPYVNEVLSLDKNELRVDLPIMLERIAVFCRDNLWRKNFSIAFSPRWSSDTMPEVFTVYLSGALERIGYGTNPFKSWMNEIPAETVELDNFLLTKNIVTPRNVISDVKKNFYLLTAAGFQVTKTHMELWYSMEDFQRAKLLLEDLPPSAKKIILGIGASAPTKKYPVDKLLVALKNLLSRKDLVFIIVGAKSEANEAEFLEKNLPRGKVLNLAGKTTLRETAAVISQTDFYIGNDTGVLHMAATAHIPLIGIYRGAVDRDNISPAILNEYKRFPPYNTKAIALRPEHPLDDCATSPPVFGFCRHSNIPHCITQIPPRAIVEAFEKLEEL